MDHVSSEQLRDRLTGALIGLARSANGSEHLITPSVTRVIVDGLAATLPDNCENGALEALIRRAEAEKREMVPNCFTCAMPCGRTNDYDMWKLHTAEADVRRLKEELLHGIRCMAAKTDRSNEMERFFYKALFFIGMDDFGVDPLQPVVAEMKTF